MPAVVISACRHCGRSKVCRPRGLCWSCYYTPGVKERFPPVSKFGVRGIGHSAGRLAPVPTDAAPGSDEKVAAMAWRVSNGYLPFHPLDGVARALAVTLVVPPDHATAVRRVSEANRGCER